MTVIDEYSENPYDPSDSVPIEDCFDEFSQQHWQNKTAAVTDEFIKLKFQCETLQRDRERDASLISSLRHEVGGVTGRLAAAANEHRDTRNHWLAEKSELESRTFQMLALQTQIQGTMRKKEKDYEKLQGQLDKIVRDSNRGNKAVITVSKPIQKNSSQVKATGTLLDAELIAAKSIISLLQHENDDLRQAVEGLAQSVQLLQEEIVKSEAKHETNYEEMKDEIRAEMKEEMKTKVTFSDSQEEGHFVTAPNTPSVADPGSDERRKAEISENLSTVTFMAKELDCEVMGENGEEENGEERDSVPFTPTALAGCMNDVQRTPRTPFIEGTPSARPVRWIVGQVSTEVKRLRDRAERAQDSANTPRTPRTRNTSEEKRLKTKLSEAFSVIMEQDRLIQLALFGHIAGLYTNTETELGEINENLAKSVSPEIEKYVFSPFPKSNVAGRSEDSYKDFDADFLPPASPATMEILKAMNWPVLPRDSSKEHSAERSLRSTTERFSIGEHSSSENIFGHNDIDFKECSSGQNSSAKNLLGNVEDLLSSLLSSPQKILFNSDKKSEKKLPISVYNSNSEFDGEKTEIIQCSENNENNENNLPVGALKVSVKKIKQCIPTLKRATSGYSGVKSVHNEEIKENINENKPENKSQNIESKPLQRTSSQKKIINIHISELREITQNEHLQSHKKLFIPKEVDDEEMAPRVLDMNEM